MQVSQAEALRAPFDDAVIGQLPRSICRECSDSRSGVCEKHNKRRCDGSLPNLPKGCGNYMTEAHIHLDYVGHAAVTDRLLQVDPGFFWEPVATDPSTGAPLKADGGLWIRLTVAGVTRYGWGDGKNIKECIGDAIRNAAMRFGVALDLWAKEDLHAAPPANPADPATIADIMARLDAIEPKELRTEAKVAFKQQYGLPDDLTASQLPTALALVTEYEQKARVAAEPEVTPSAEADVAAPEAASEPEPGTDEPYDPVERSRPDFKALARELAMPEGVALSIARDLAAKRGVRKPVMLKDVPAELDADLVFLMTERAAADEAEATEAVGA